jgi:RNA-directed DNA polymerase
MLASKAGAHYRPFEHLKAPKPFQRKPASTKVRRIDNPSEELKFIQKRVYEQLLKPLDLPNYMCGGVPGKQTLDNARLHLGARVLIRVDIAHFFPSVTNVQVYGVWRDLLGCSTLISGLLTQLTTFERRLPQGAPTSTLLANLVLLMADAPIRAECNRLGIRYSSWIDDLAFSSDNPRDILNAVFAALNQAGFTVARRKLEIMGPRERKILCGVLLGRFLSIPPNKVSAIRSGVHKLRTNEIPPTDLDRYVRSLHGGIAHIRSVSPTKAQKLSLNLDSALHGH